MPEFPLPRTGAGAVVSHLAARIAAPFAILLLVSVVATACATAQGDADSFAPTEAPDAALGLGPAAVAYDPIGAAPAIDLIRSDGTPFGLADVSGSPLLVFFGYTHCPDVCPATFGVLINVLDERPDVSVAFITIDPERDTPEWLAGWMDYLPSQIVGLSGTPAQIRSTADAYGARYAKGDATSGGGYLMSHTADIYMIDDHGRLLAKYPFGTDADAIVDDLARAVPPPASLADSAA